MSRFEETEDRPSQASQLIASSVKAMEPETVAALRDLLAAELSITRRSASREQRLGLLAELVRHGEWVTQERYETERALRAEQGDAFSSAASLAKLFGGWSNAMKAALKLYFHGSRARVPSDHHHGAGRRAGYSREATVLALKLARQDLGDWPTQWEYTDWASQRRQLARYRGQPDPRLPGLPQIRRLFGGSFTRAIQCCDSEADAHDLN